MSASDISPESLAQLSAPELIYLYKQDPSLNERLPDAARQRIRDYLNSPEGRSPAQV